MKSMRQNIYIDIDGVILTKGGMPALHLDTFLRHILSKYSVSWLTSRCHGDSKYTVKYLSQFLSPQTVVLAQKIKPTDFQIDKTEAIDFSRQFFWLDNELFASEENTLKKLGKYDSWIEVNLIKNPNQLIHLVHNRLCS